MANNDGGGSFMDPNATGMTSVPVHLRHQFHIKHTGVDGKIYEGQFACKKLSIKEIAQVSVRKVQLNGGYHHVEDSPGRGLDADTDWTNQMISHLEIGLIQQPMWFILDNIYDVDLLLKVYSEIAKFENTFMSPQRGAAVSAESSQADSGSKSEGSGAAGRIAEVGGGQVQPSLDP